MTVAVQEAFVANLLAIDGLETLISNRVYPLAVPSSAPLPSIQYRFSDGFREPYFRNSFGLTEYEVQMDVYSTSYRVLQTIVDLIEAHFHGFSGELATGVLAQRIIVTNTLNTIDTSNGEVYRTIIELTLNT